MKLRISTPTRIAFGLTSLVITWILIVAYFGMVPDTRQQALEARCSLCEAVAVQCCLSAQRGDVPTMKVLLDSLAARNVSVLSSAIRRKDGTVLAENGDHASQWRTEGEPPLPGAQIKVPIFENRSLWGWLEVRFQPVGGTSWWARAFTPTIRLLLVVGCGVFLLQRLYVRKVLRYLDPASVVPERVRAALDVLTEGVIILDNQQQIVLANRAFAEQLGQAPERLQGFRPSSIEWSFPEGEENPPDLPWVDAVQKGITQRGVMMRMAGAADEVRTLSVNAIPIVGGNGLRRGALATFDDVTTVEQQNLELARMLAALKDSRDEIQRQNHELYVLATCDPLTQCLNRRSFFEKLETQWATASRYGQAMSFVMVDVDHFKSVNDRFGHSTGDVVLKKVGEILRTAARDCDLVCRYGGEEFCILLPQQDSDHAVAAAERYRRGVAAAQFEQFTVTASFGVSTTHGAVGTPQELLEQADKALYAAKHSGRNRVVCWQHLPGEPSSAVPPAGEPDDRDGADRATPEAFPISFVRGLTAALACRDTMTAERSRRVAELCVATAEGLMSPTECRELEVAALLHDIGKLAIPDAILFKPGKLTEEEWAVMHTHDSLGAEILEASSAPRSLIEIVRTHHAWYSGSPHNPALPRGSDIPLAARILAVADAFVAMISDSHYRKACAWDEALAELRRSAGSQFDSQLVDRFIDVAAETDRTRKSPHGSVSQQAVLAIGLQIERLAMAMDQRDLAAVAEMAGHLATIATHDGASEIANLAQQLERSAASEPDLVQLVKQTSQLLDVCKSMQSAHLGQREVRTTGPLPACGVMSGLG